MKKIGLNPDENWTYSKFKSSFEKAFYDVLPEDRDNAMKAEYEKLTGKKVKKKNKPTESQGKNEEGSED